MQTLSYQEISQVSGGFSTTNILCSMEGGMVVGLCVGLLTQTQIIPAVAFGAAFFGALAIIHEAAESFDRHYGYRF